MVCYISCGIAVGFIIASLLTMLAKNDDFLALRASFNNDDKKIMDNIVKERILLYVKGSLLGLVIATVFLVWVQNKFAKYTTICSFIVIMFLVQLSVYIITPKKNYILNLIKTPEQNKLWLSVYKDMKKRYHSGFLIGLLGYGALCYAFVINKNKL
jgi:hypothetical protein